MSMPASVMAPAAEPPALELAALSPSPSPLVLSTAELALCTCPEFCERDHDRD
jgi:hypothetical protein